MIKRTLLLLCSAFLPLLLSAQQAADKIAPDLMQRMTDAPADLQGAVLILADQEDTRAMLLDFETRNVSMEERSYEVITRLQNKANSTQPAVMAQIRNTPGVNQNSAYPVWIINAIYVQANASAILRLAELPEIGEIQWGDAPLSIDPPVARTQAASSPNGSEVGLKAIKANFMWNLG